MRLGRRVVVLVPLLYGFSTATSGDVAISLGLICLGVIAVALFVRRQSRLPEPLLDVSVMRVREFRVGAVAVLALQALFMAASTLVPLLVQSGMGYSATVSGLVIFPGALIAAGMSLVSGRLHDAFGVRLPAALGAALLLAGFAGLALLPMAGLLFAGACMAAISCGGVIAFTPLLTWGINAIGDARIPHGNALSNTLRQASSSVGTALFVSIVSAAQAASGLSGSAGVAVGAQVASAVGAGVAALVLAYLFFGTCEPTGSQETSNRIARDIRRVKG